MDSDLSQNSSPVHECEVCELTNDNKVGNIYLHFLATLHVKVSSKKKKLVGGGACIQSQFSVPVGNGIRWGASS